MNHDILIAIDGRILMDSPRSSIAVYLRSLLGEWEKQETPPRILLLLPRQPSVFDAASMRWNNVQLASPQKPCYPDSRFLALCKWHQWDIPRLLIRHQPSVYFSPFHFTAQLPLGMRMVTTIHDLCFLSEPKFSTGSLIHRFQVLSACIRANRLVCVSHFTAGILRHWWPRVSRNATVAQNGQAAPAMQEKEAREILLTLDSEIVSQKYFVWIGKPAPRKNITGILDTFALYRRETSGRERLVLVAPPQYNPQLRALAKERGIIDALTLLSDISDATRDALYRCATALVFPSRCEGFGYPVLEAMAQGCPPITCRKGPSLEIVGDAFPLAKTLEPSELSKVMALAANLASEDRKETGKRLMERAAHFTIAAMAEKTLRAILEAAHV